MEFEFTSNLSTIFFFLFFLSYLLLMFIRQQIIPFFRKFSTPKKFYEIDAPQSSSIIPSLPEDAVFSKYLNELDHEKPKETSTWMEKKKQFSYNELLNGNPYGSIETFMFKDVKLTLVSTNYHRLEAKKLHKVIYKAHPDGIVVQRRPQYYLRDFSLYPKGDDGVFSDINYLQQLKITPDEIRPKEKSSRPLVNAFNKTRDDVLQQNPEKQVLGKGFQTVYDYVASYNTHLYLGELPGRAFRQWIANSHTLMELQQMYKNICRRMPRYKNFNFNPYKLGTLIYPSTFLKLNDQYMGTLIQMMISTKKYKSIVGIFGIMENIAVKQMLESEQTMKPIIQLLSPNPPKGSILRDIENFQILEKHILLDCLFYGEEVINIKLQHLHLTNAIIEKYCQNIPKQTLMKFRFDKTMEYVKLLKQKVKEGEEEIKKEFVRETLRQ